MYLWLKAAHLIALIAWMAGMLYLPRLFVYHAQADDAISIARFKLMERRLLKAIMTPAMIVTWLFGLYLIYEGGWLTSGWRAGPKNFWQDFVKGLSTHLRVSGPLAAPSMKPFILPPLMSMTDALCPCGPPICVSILER